MTMAKQVSKTNQIKANALNTSKKALDTTEIEEPAVDILVVEILSLREHDESRDFAVKCSFCDYKIFHGNIYSIGSRERRPRETMISGMMQFDPSDYENMCLFADHPLIVTIQPLQFEMAGEYVQEESQPSEDVLMNEGSLFQPVANKTEVSCCNVDILPIFLSEDNKKIKIEKRMEPLIKPSVLQCRSWDTLPLLTLEISIIREKANAPYHEILKDPNWMKLTVIGAYNMIIPYEPNYVYAAASKIPVQSEQNSSIILFNSGTGAFNNFKPTNLYPQWATLAERSFTKADEKYICNIEDIQNEFDIDLNHYINSSNQSNTTVWNSFHRSLLLKSSENWFSKYINKYKWPLEVHIYADEGGYSFMAFLNLFDLLKPGEHTLRIAVPLSWIDASTMLEECSCELLLPPNEKAPPPKTTSTMRYASSAIVGSNYALTDIQTTGADESDAFVIVEVKMARPLKENVIPKPLYIQDMNDMLKELEEAGAVKRRCKGRGQLAKDWQSIIRVAATSLRRVPYYGGITEFCAFNRQLSETRTRVELTTSFWQEAAIYVNNNFVVQQFLHSEEMFEEMLMMSYACLMKVVRNTLIATDKIKTLNQVLISARQARQMQDIHHAMELYMQVIAENPKDGNIWRELATCLKDIDLDWADVCLSRSLVLDPRHPLTLISKGGMVFDKDPHAAEIFFVALLTFFPFWLTAWVIVSAYYFERQHFILAEKILEVVKKSRREGDPVTEELGYGRQWELELGDWWDSTPRLPGTNAFYDAADLLLRLRCVTLAEVCMSRALSITGEMSCVYYHLVALCCRLRGQYSQALCLLNVAIEKFGEVFYIRSLEAECYHKMDNIPASMASFKKTGTFGGAYTILMSLPALDEPQHIRSILEDLIREQPCAYSWMALANDWIKKIQSKSDQREGRRHPDEVATVKQCAIACAEQALKWDRRAGSAWSLLADFVKPSARRFYCAKMASLCNFKPKKARLETDRDSQQSLGYRLGVAVTECRCPMCEGLRI